MALSAKLLRFLPGALALSTIFIVSHRPGDDITLPAFWGADKIVHAAVYACLYLSFYLAFVRPKSLIKDISLWICFIYGALDEFHQSFVPGRDASVGDWLADCSGALICAIYIAPIPLFSKIKRVLFKIL